MALQTGLIIFARMGSTRFPGKMMTPVCGRPLIGRVVDRARLVSGSHRIVIATSSSVQDDPIAGFASAEDVEIFRGCLEDVAQRALTCCEAYGFDRFARICGDRPFLPWELIDRLLELQASEDLDLATNAQIKSYPSGTMTEILTTNALRNVLDKSSNSDDREHVTRYIYSHPQSFRIANHRAKRKGLQHLSLSLDERDQLQRIEWIMSQLGSEPERAQLEDVVLLAEQISTAH